MTLLMILQKWRELSIGLLAFLLLICLFLLNNKTGQIEKYKQAEIVQQAEIAKAKADALTQEKTWAEKQLKAEQNYNAKLKQIQNDADTARSSANSLSKQLKTANERMSKASRETVIEYSETANKLLEDCSTRYIWMAERADAERVDKEKLDESWVEATQ